MVLCNFARQQLMAVTGTGTVDVIVAAENISVKGELNSDFSVYNHFSKGERTKKNFFSNKTELSL